MSTPQTKLGKAIEVLLCVAALAVLAANIALFRENRQLREATAPQIAARTQLQMLAGLTLDGHIEPVNLPPEERSCSSSHSRRDVQPARQTRRNG